MHIWRVRHPASGAVGYAVLKDGAYVALETPFEDLMDAMRTGAPLDLGEAIGTPDAVEILAPVQPSKVVCVGLNYLRHAQEMGKAVPEEPLIFLKPPSAVNAPGEPIARPRQSEEVHHEGELAIVIGKRTRHVTDDQVAGHILGYTCADDVTARDIQRREKRYTRAKGFDTFCPLGPCIALADQFIPREHRLTCRVNGVVRQESTLDDFIFAIPTVVAFISRIMTLYPGDVILTGTPAGVGPIVAGDIVEVDIDGIGTLQNPVR